LSKKRRRGIFQELNWFGLPFNPFLLAIGGWTFQRRTVLIHARAQAKPADHES
jgi:hypothetical protein